MDPCKQHEPQVINHKMIARCLDQQGLKGELGRLAREEGIPWEEVLHIRLEFMHIIRIDHLWVLPGLTMLSLSNNLIEEIENLETLVNLRELDLSFNKIKKIKNLEELVNLEIINLFNNQINEMENMNTLSKLQIFSIGNNNITSKDNVLYLRQFVHLKSVNLAGNPCTTQNDFRAYIAIFLPRLVYYEYKMIEEHEREQGQQLYAKELVDLENVECVVREAQQKVEAELAEAELHSESFVEFLGDSHLFDQMFEDDADGKLLLKVGDEAKDYYNDYEAQFLEITKQIFENGQDQYRLRKYEVNQFHDVTKEAQLKNQEESIEYMEKFAHFKREAFKNISEQKELYQEGKIQMRDYDAKCDEFRKEYHVETFNTWKILMGLEMMLFEQMEETNQSFEQALTEMVNNFIEMAQGFFAQTRTAQATYNELITEMATRYLTTLALTPEMVVPPDLAPIFADRDTLINALGGSHDLHQLAIDNREDTLIRRARAWLNNLVNDLQKNEVLRSRTKILEIIHYLDIQKDDFEYMAVLQELSADL